VRLERVFAN